MAFTGKMVRQVVIKSDGNVFHEIFRDRPHHTSTMSPAEVQSVNLHEGDWGKVGSIMIWNYTLGIWKKNIAKDVIEATDEEKKSLTVKIIDGDLLQLYKSFVMTVHVDTVSDDNLVTWTFEYEKLIENIEDPVTLMDFAIELTKHIEDHHLK